jgi:hypothetical protein
MAFCRSRRGLTIGSNDLGRIFEVPVYSNFSVPQTGLPSKAGKGRDGPASRRANARGRVLRRPSQRVTRLSKSPARTPWGSTMQIQQEEISDSTAESGEKKASMRTVVAASAIGTTIEWYDFLIYSTAASLVLNKLFFPTRDPLVGKLLAIGTIGVGFFVRPLGAVILSHFGDRMGRKSMLVLTLVSMGVGTVLIGLLPTYETIGVAAPILLVACRSVQGIAVGGEWGGAVLMAIEHSPAYRRNAGLQAQCTRGQDCALSSSRHRPSTSERPARRVGRSNHGGILDLRYHDFRSQLCRDEHGSSAHPRVGSDCAGSRRRADYDPVVRRALRSNRTPPGLPAWLSGCDCFVVSDLLGDRDARPVDGRPGFCDRHVRGPRHHVWRTGELPERRGLRIQTALSPRLGPVLPPVPTRRVPVDLLLAAERVRWARITNATRQQIALGDAPADAVLRRLGDSSGFPTLSTPISDVNRVVASDSHSAQQPSSHHRLDTSAWWSARFSAKIPAPLSREAMPVTLQTKSIIAASPEEVWSRVTHPDGINYELAPVMRMTANILSGLFRHRHRRLGRWFASRSSGRPDTMSAAPTRAGPSL